MGDDIPYDDFEDQGGPDRRQWDTLSEELWRESKKWEGEIPSESKGHSAITEEPIMQSLLIGGNPEHQAALFAALSAFQGAIHGVTKSADNPFFNSKYADLAALWDVIREPLSKNGLAVVQMPMAENKLVTLLTHKAGGYIQFSHPMTPKKDDPQGIGSAITYNRRYCIAAVLGLAQQDDDGNAASGKGAPASGLDEKQVAQINDLLKKYNMRVGPILQHFKVNDLSEIAPAKFSTILKQVTTKGEKKMAASKQADVPGPEETDNADS